MSEERGTDQTLLQMSTPLLLSALIGMVAMLVDTMMISAYSENAAAAVSIANQILLVAFDLSAFFAAGAVVLISRSLGAKREIEARRFAETAMAGNALIGLVLGFVLFLGAPWWIQAINCPPEAAEGAEIYLRVGGFTIFFNGIMIAGTATLRAYGRTRILLWLGLLAYGGYLPFAYLLIFGIGPFPELGVEGSALATLFVRAIAVVLLIIVFARTLKIRPHFWKRSWSSSCQRLRQMFTLIWPGALDNLAYGFYQIILVSFIAGISVVMVLSRTFTLALNNFLTVLLMSISQANEVMVGYRYGAKKWKAVSRCIVHSSVVATMITMVAASFLYFGREPLLSLFTKQKEVIELAGELLLITIFVQPFSAVNTILYYSLKAVGDVVVPVVGTQIMMWGLSVPFAYFLVVEAGFGVSGLWYVLLAEEALKALFLVWRWRTYKGGKSEAEDRPD
jgi:putative MATE family efflux protein